MPDAPLVKVGQVWGDVSKKGAGRTLLVEAIVDGDAVCSILTLAGGREPRYAEQGRFPKTVYSVRRFRPNLWNGFRLLEDVVVSGRVPR